MGLTKSNNSRDIILFEGKSYNPTVGSSVISRIFGNKGGNVNRYDAVMSTISNKYKSHFFKGVYSSAELELKLREVDNFHLYIKAMLERVAEPGHESFDLLKSGDAKEFAISVGSIEGDARKKAFLNYIQGVYYVGKYAYNLAIPKFEKAILLDPNSNKYRSELMATHIKLGDFGSAKSVGEDSLNNQAMTSDTSELAVTYAYLMIIYVKLKDFEKAMVCKKRAESLGINQGRYEWDNFRYAKVLKLLGDTLYCWGQYDSAKLYYNKALAFNSRMMEANRNVLLDLDLLCANCDVWVKTGRFGKAEEYAKKAENALYSLANGKSLRTAWVYSLKGKIQEIRGNYSQACGFYRSAIVELEGSVGAFHLLSGVIFADYARCNAIGGIGESVGGYLANSVAACKSGLIFTDDDKYNKNFTCGRAKKNLRDYSTAIKFFKKALSNYVDEFGRYSFKVFTAQKSIAKCYLKLGKKGKAKKYVLEALQTYQGLCLPDFPEYVTLLILYGDFLMADKELNTAVSFYERALSMASQNYGSVNAITAKVYERLSEVYAKNEIYDKAISYLNSLLSFKSGAFGAREIDSASNYRQLASLWYKNGNPTKAKEYYYKVYQIYFKELGVSSKETEAAKKEFEKIDQAMKSKAVNKKR